MKPRSDKKPEATVRAIYRKLSRAWGQQHWWPAETPFEVIVGAILTQNTSWTNVERAMANLRSAGMLNVESLRELALPKLEGLVRSSGYFRQKAQRLKNFVAFLDAMHGLARVYQDTEQFDKAIAVANRIAELDPDDVLAHTSLSILYQRKGMVPEAEAEANKARILGWKQQLKQGKQSPE